MVGERGGQVLVVLHMYVLVRSNYCFGYGFYTLLSGSTIRVGGKESTYCSVIWTLVYSVPLAKHLTNSKFKLGCMEFKTNYFV